MKEFNGMFWLKLGVAVVGAGVTLAQNYFEKKEIDTRIAEKVAEALQNQVKGS